MGLLRVRLTEEVLHASVVRREMLHRIMGLRPFLPTQYLFSVAGWCAVMACVMAVSVAPLRAEPADPVVLVPLVLRGNVAAADAETAEAAIRSWLWDQNRLAWMLGDGTEPCKNPLKGLGDAEKATVAARARFDELDYRGCVKQLKRAQKLYDDGPAFVTASPAVAQGLLLLALCQERSGDHAAALQTHRRFASRFGNVEPDPEVFPPSVADAVSVARTQLSVVQVDLEVLSQPPGARVMVDGVWRGTTPLRTQVSPGMHHLLVQDGHGVARTARAEATEGGKPLRVSVEMEAAAWQQAMALVAEALAKGNAAQLRTAAAAVGRLSGGRKVVAGALVESAERGRPMLMLVRMAAGGAVEVAQVQVLPDGEGLEPAAVDAVRAVLAADATALSPEERAVVYTGADALPNNVSTEEPSPLPRLLVPLAAGLTLPLAAVAVALLAAGGASVTALVGWLVLYPPNPNGTDVYVDGRKLTR